MSESHIDNFFRANLSEYPTPDYSDWSALETKMKRKIFSAHTTRFFFTVAAAVILFLGWRHIYQPSPENLQGKSIYVIQNSTPIQNSKPVFVATKQDKQTNSEKNTNQHNKNQTTVVIKRTIIVRDTLQSAGNK